MPSTWQPSTTEPPTAGRSISTLIAAISAFDAVAIWRRIVEENSPAFTRSLPSETIRGLPLVLAHMYRGISRRKLRLYPFAREMLDALRGRIPIALVTDAQSAYARAELRKVGILDYFDTVIVSGDHGYRKPDRRLFQYVGNDMHRDIYGAAMAGIRR